MIATDRSRHSGSAGGNTVWREDHGKIVAVKPNETCADEADQSGVTQAVKDIAMSYPADDYYATGTGR
jgi:hypothetical protein